MKMRLTAKENFQLGKLISDAGPGFSPTAVAKAYNASVTERGRKIEPSHVNRMAKQLGIVPASVPAAKRTSSEATGRYKFLLDKMKTQDEKLDALLALVSQMAADLGVPAKLATAAKPTVQSDGFDGNDGN